MLWWTRKVSSQISAMRRTPTPLERLPSNSTGHLSRAPTTLSLDSLSAEIRSTRTLNQFDIASKVSLDLCLTHPVFWGTLFARGCSSGPPPQCSALRLGSLSYCWRAEPHLWRDEDRQSSAR